MTKGYSGADIENIVKESVEALFLSNDKKINYDLIEGIVKETTSISEALKKQVEDYQSKYDQLKIKNASDNQHVYLGGYCFYVEDQDTDNHV